jgi:hypothetical protein
MRIAAAGNPLSSSPPMMLLAMLPAPIKAIWGAVTVPILCKIQLGSIHAVAGRVRRGRRRA